MKVKTLSIGFSLLLLAALPAAASDLPTLEPLRLDRTPAGTCADPADLAVRTGVGGGIGAGLTCHAFAQCSSGTVDCFAWTGCRVVDRDCDVGERGFVECDGIRTYCPEPCPCTCQQGATCMDDSDCDCNQGLGFCQKDDPLAIDGSCVCDV